MFGTALFTCLADPDWLAACLPACRAKGWVMAGGCCRWAARRFTHALGNAWLLLPITMGYDVGAYEGGVLWFLSGCALCGAACVKLMLWQLGNLLMLLGVGCWCVPLDGTLGNCCCTTLQVRGLWQICLVLLVLLSLQKCWGSWYHCAT